MFTYKVSKMTEDHCTEQQERKRPIRVNTYYRDCDKNRAFEA